MGLWILDDFDLVGGKVVHRHIIPFLGIINNILSNALQFLVIADNVVIKS